jgi:hypothetical protein
VSSKDNLSGPPGPPRPPPAPGSQQQDVSRYKSFLDSAGVSAAEGELYEEERLRVGAWRFYYRGPVTARSNQAAIDDSGRVVTIKHLEHWHQFLSDPSLDAAGAHLRIAWLLGHAAEVAPGFKFKDAEAQKRVKEPALDRAPDGRVTFTGWFVYPPQMQVPYQVTVRAPEQGPAVIENTEWSKI